MKTILCFGDSNTWGYEPDLGGRLPMDQRWPGVMRLALGADYWVIEEGLNGRTTVWDDPVEGDKSGKAHLLTILLSHNPLDLVILMLGTNDLKARFSAPAVNIAQSVGVLIDLIHLHGQTTQGLPPQTLLAAPFPLGPQAKQQANWAGGYEKSQQFAELYQAVAKEKSVAFIDAGQHAQASPSDPIHLDAPQHAKLGQAMARKAKELLG